MNIRYGRFLALPIFLLFVLSFSASAQPPLRRVILGPLQPVCQAVPSVYIRNLRYDDYTRYAILSPTNVAPGGFIQISTRCLRFDGQVVVTLQDVTRGPGYGVTAFRLTNVRVSGNTVIAQVPPYPIFRNRTYHLGLFVYGQPWKTANPGAITIR